MRYYAENELDKADRVSPEPILPKNLLNLFFSILDVTMGHLK